MQLFDVAQEIQPDVGNTLVKSPDPILPVV